MKIIYFIIFMCLMNFSFAQRVLNTYNLSPSNIDTSLNYPFIKDSSMMVLATDLEKYEIENVIEPLNILVADTCSSRYIIHREDSTRTFVYPTYVIKGYKVTTFFKYKYFGMLEQHVKYLNFYKQEFSECFNVISKNNDL